MTLDANTWALIGLAGAAFAALLVRRLLKGKGPPRRRAPLWAVFCRGCVLLGLGLVAGSVAVAAVRLFGPSPYLLLFLLGLLALAAARRRIRLGGWSGGTAHWPTPGDLLRAGLLSGREGLLLGKVAPPSAAEGFWQLLRAPLADSAVACGLFLAALRRDPRAGAWVRAAAVNHAAAFIPTGGGKGVNLVVPTLLTHPGSVVVLDVKGENARLTAEHRRKKFGHRIVLLDPFRQVTQKPDTLNPLAHIDRADPQALDLCRALSAALVVRDEHEKERHWNDAAEQWIGVVISWVLHVSPKGATDLQSVCEMLASPAELQTAIALMAKSDAWGGLLQRLAGQLGHFTGDEKGSVLTTANRHLRFLSTPALVESTASSSFDPAGLGDKMSVYLVIPPEYLTSLAGLLRLWLDTLLRSRTKGGPQERDKVLFLLDEASALGHMTVIDEAIDRLRGYGVRLFFLYQSLGQLKQCFPDGRDQTFLSNMDVQIYAGLKDLESAQLVSQRLGTATVQVVSENVGGGTSTTTDHLGQQSRSRSGNEGLTVSEQARELLKPDEVMNLGERKAIVVAPRVRPFVTEMVRYYERDFDTAPGQRPFRQALGLVARSVGFLAFCALMSAAVLALAFGVVTGGPAAPPATQTAPTIQEWPPAWPAP